MAERTMSLLEKMQARLRQLESQQNKKVVLKEGVNRFRVLPSWRGPDEEFFLEVMTHYDVTPDVKYLICLQTVGEECPVCKRVARWSLGDSTQQARAERVGAKSQFMMNVVPIAEGLPPEVKIYAASRGVVYELLGFFTDSEYGNFTDPESGFDVLVTRKGEKLNTKYTVRLARNPSRLRMKGWQAKLIDLDREFRPKSRQEMLTLLGAKSQNGVVADVRRKDERAQVRDAGRRARREESEDDIPF
jgi:hypothetical protein